MEKIKIIKQYGDYPENAFGVKYLIYKVETKKDWKEFLDGIKEQLEYAENGEKMKLVVGEMSLKKFNEINEVD